MIDKITHNRNGYLMLALGSIGVCFFQSIIIMYLLIHEKIYLVPPSIEKSFWVSSSHVSPEYLSEMTAFFAYLRLNATSDSIIQQREMLLRYTDPSFYEELKTQLVQEEDRINQQHISMAFYPVDIKVDAKQLKAVIQGDLKSNVGDAAIPAKRLTYLISYHYNAGRLLVKSFEEVKNA